MESALKNRAFGAHLIFGATLANQFSIPKGNRALTLTAL